MPESGTHADMEPGGCPVMPETAAMSARLRRHERALRQGLARAEASQARQALPSAPCADDTEPPALAILRGELAETERALRRLTDGAYGRCATCGQPIALARLRAVPSARRCDACAQAASAAAPRHVPTIHGEGHSGDERRLI